jgi:hypothetical protein
MGKKDEIKVEVEAGGREIEIKIDPETHEMTIDEEEESDEAEDEDSRDDESDDGNASSNAAGPEKKRGRLLLGLVLGGLLGGAMARGLARLLAGEPSSDTQGAPGGPEAPSDGLMGTLGNRWHEATNEGRRAARDAEQKALARYRELTKD